MARIANVNIPDNKHLCISLSYIYGIGRPLAKKICMAVGINPAFKTKDLSDEQLIKIRKYIDEQIEAQKLLLEGDLRREVANNIKRHIEIGTYKGTRHRKRLPARGQNTHSNAKTRKRMSQSITKNTTIAKAPKNSKVKA